MNKQHHHIDALVKKATEVAKQFASSTKSAVTNYIEEKNQKALEEQHRQEEYARTQILTTCYKEFVDVLKDMPAEFNIQKELAVYSLSGNFVTNCSISLRIPKADASVTLRPTQCITLRNEIQGRTERLRHEAQLMRDDFYRKYNYDYNIIAEKCYYSGHKKELLDYMAKAKIDEAQLYQTIFMRFWQFNIIRVMDTGDSNYITVDFFISFPQQRS